MLKPEQLQEIWECESRGVYEGISRVRIHQLLTHIDHLQKQLDAKPVSVSCREHVWKPMRAEIDHLNAQVKKAKQWLKEMAEEGCSGNIGDHSHCAEAAESGYEDFITEDWCLPCRCNALYHQLEGGQKP